MLLKKGKADYWTFLIVVVLVGIGLVMVLSASQYFASYKPYEDSFYFLKRQAGNVFVGMIVMIFAMQLNYRIYKRFAVLGIIIGFGIMALITFTGLGDDSKGSVRWIDLGFVRFMPSDLMKYCMVLFFARFLVGRKKPIENFFRDFMPYLLVAAAGCGIVAVNDLGTAIVLAGTVFFMFIIAKVPKRYLAIVILLGVALVVLAIAVAPYRMERITSFLDPWSDPSDGGYQIIQSLLAIGSGGFMGVGLGAGGAKWFYLPERHTDFIFSVLVEEGGFIFGTFVIILFMMFVWRGVTIALKIEDDFGSMLAVGVTLMIGLQAMVNIAISLGLMPVTGITLPFISYGGTSIVVSMGAVGVLLNISRFAKINK